MSNTTTSNHRRRIRNRHKNKEFDVEVATKQLLEIKEQSISNSYPVIWDHLSPQDKLSWILNSDFQNKKLEPTDFIDSWTEWSFPLLIEACHTKTSCPVCCEDEHVRNDCSCTKLQFSRADNSTIDITVLTNNSPTASIWFQLYHTGTHNGFINFNTQNKLLVSRFDENYKLIFVKVKKVASNSLVLPKFTRPTVTLHCGEEDNPSQDVLLPLDLFESWGWKRVPSRTEGQRCIRDRPCTSEYCLSVYGNRSIWSRLQDMSESKTILQTDLNHLKAVISADRDAWYEYLCVVELEKLVLKDYNYATQVYHTIYHIRNCSRDSVRALWQRCKEIISNGNKALSVKTVETTGHNEGKGR